MTWDYNHIISKSRENPRTISKKKLLTVCFHVGKGQFSWESMVGVESLVDLPGSCQARKLLFQFQSEKN